MRGWQGWMKKEPRMEGEERREGGREGGREGECRRLSTYQSKNARGRQVRVGPPATRDEEPPARRWAAPASCSAVRTAEGDRRQEQSMGSGGEEPQALVGVRLLKQS
eukprot:754333-Hanusia_phi.AAC.2